MGFRIKKSVNVGGGLRVNFSKHGVGYSIGGKGFRVTKKSTGGTRMTASIPNTGISHVTETSGKKKPATTKEGKKPFYKKWWFIVLIVIIILAAIGGSGSSEAQACQQEYNEIQEIQIQ